MQWLQKPYPKRLTDTERFPFQRVQFQQLQRAWYAIGDLGTLLEETRTDTVSNPQYIIRALAGELGEVVTELEEKFEQAEGGGPQYIEHPLIAKARDVIETGDKLHVDALDKLLDGYGLCPDEHPDGHAKVRAQEEERDNL